MCDTPGCTRQPDVDLGPGHKYCGACGLEVYLERYPHLKAMLKPRRTLALRAAR